MIKKQKKENVKQNTSQLECGQVLWFYGSAHNWFFAQCNKNKMVVVRVYRYAIIAAPVALVATFCAKCCQPWLALTSQQMGQAGRGAGSGLEHAAVGELKNSIRNLHSCRTSRRSCPFPQWAKGPIGERVRRTAPWHWQLYWQPDSHIQLQLQWQLQFQWLPHVHPLCNRACGKLNFCGQPVGRGQTDRARRGSKLTREREPNECECVCVWLTARYPMESWQLRKIQPFLEVSTCAYVYPIIPQDLHFILQLFINLRKYRINDINMTDILYATFKISIYSYISILLKLFSHNKFLIRPKKQE